MPKLEEGVIPTNQETLEAPDPPGSLPQDPTLAPTEPEDDGEPAESLDTADTEAGASAVIDPPVSLGFRDGKGQRWVHRTDMQMWWARRESEGNLIKTLDAEGQRIQRTAPVRLDLMGQLRAGLMDIDYSTCMETDISRKPRHMEPPPGRIDPVQVPELRGSWAAAWSSYPSINGVIKTTQKKTVQRVYPVEWVVTCAALLVLIEKFEGTSSYGPDYLSLPPVRGINRWCTLNFFPVWKPGEWTPRLIIHEGLFHRGLPPAPPFVDALRAIGVLDPRLLTRDMRLTMEAGRAFAMEMLWGNARKEAILPFFLEDGDLEPSADPVQDAVGQVQRQVAQRHPQENTQRPKTATEARARAEAQAAAEILREVPDTPAGPAAPLIRANDGGSVANLTGLNPRQAEVARRSGAMPPLPKEHFVHRITTGDVDRSVREVDAAHVGLESAIRMSDIILGAVGQTLTRVMEDPEALAIPDVIDAKYLSSLTMALQRATRTLESAVALSRKTGGEPDQTVLHTLLRVANEMTPAERQSYRKTGVLPGRLLTGGSITSGGDAIRLEPAEAEVIDVDVKPTTENPLEARARAGAKVGGPMAPAMASTSTGSPGIQEAAGTVLDRLRRKPPGVG